MSTYIKDHTNTFLIHGHRYEVTAPARFDQETDELVDDLKLDDQAVEIANQMYRAEMGLVAPIEIKKYRAKIGLSQREFAKLVGWSPNTVAIYEAGAFPNPSNNKILKALMVNDELLKTMIDQDQTPDTIIKKIKNYLKRDSQEIIPIDPPKPKFNALQLANWFRVNNYFSAQSDENVEELTQMKVVKLLYFAFGRYAAETKGKLFESPILALPYGPVVQEVHQKFKGQKGIIGNKLEDEAFEDYSNIQSDSDISNLLLGILNDYGDFTASGLSAITHQPGSPWSLTEHGIINPTLIEQNFSRGVEN